MTQRDASRRTRVLVAAVAAFAVASACATFGPGNSTPESERAKVRQLVGPFELRSVPLRAALEAISDASTPPIKIDVCEALADHTVTMLTTGPEKLGLLVKSLAFQVGAPVRLFIGHHAEAARPTLYCPQPGDRLLTITSSRGPNVP